ncbi:MAG: zf-TFIIB domain-containing protein [Planctomycetes bacterium]|nr:zf-TFIIB domain-containing protein [Planctomycetota bacterium]
MNCPRCSTKTLLEKERDGVTIDQCPDCRGVWLDRGELERILARAQAEFDELDRARYAAPPLPPRRDYEPDDRRREKSPYDSDDHWQRPHPHSAPYPPKRRGFLHTLGELFD